MTSQIRSIDDSFFTALDFDAFTSCTLDTDDDNTKKWTQSLAKVLGLQKNSDSNDYKWLIESLIKISKKIFGNFIRDPSNKNLKYLRTKVRNLKKPLEKSGVEYEQIFKSIRNLSESRDSLDNFLKKEDVLDYEIIRVPSVYPIYRKDYEVYLKETQEYFKKIKNFFSIGRQGQFYYGDIDQMIRIGFDTADKIIKC